jgi:hypothetical protein
MHKKFETIKTQYSDDFDRDLAAFMNRDGAELVYIGTEVAQGHKPDYAIIFQIAVVSYVTYG